MAGIGAKTGHAVVHLARRSIARLSFVDEVIE